MNTQTIQANPSQPIQIQLQYPSHPPPYYSAQTAMHQPYPIFPSIPQSSYVNGYPRWNRHRRLHRSHLRMKNVDWASDDEEEEDPIQYPPYTHMHPYAHPQQQQHMHPQPTYPQDVPHPHHHSHHHGSSNDPFAPPSEDDVSYDSFPDENTDAHNHDNTQESHKTQYPIHPHTNVPVSSYVPINSVPPNITAYNSDPVNGIYTNNDERWTVTTYSKTDDDDCTCFSDATQESDIHQYVIG